MPNSAEYIIAYFACWKIGAIANPVNSLLKAEEIEFVVGNSEAKLLLVNSQFTPTVENISLPKIIEFDNVEAAKKFDEILPETILEKDDEAIIIYTSGTTGKPKGCLLTHGNLIANAGQITEWLGFGENDRLLTIMPLFHMNAVSVTTMTALYASASTVVSTKFSASKFWQIISDYKITSFGSVATMLSMLLLNNSELNPNPKSEIRNPKRFVSRCAVQRRFLPKFEKI
jgi:acyl-CoA synthetase (AMP-forming)/AMP-acid ligase II